MKTVDFHVHVAKYSMWKPEMHKLLKMSKPEIYMDFDSYMTPKTLLEIMDGAGVASAVILAENAPLVTGVVDNEFVVEFCSKSKRLIPFASVNPVTDSNPSKTLARLVEDSGMKGLKLLPSYQHFFPYDVKIYELYEKAQELGIPVNFHTGSSIFKNTKLKYADPLHLDDVAVDFPDLKIIQAHGGRGFWYDTAFFLTRLHKNVYIDITGLPPQNLLKYFPELEKIADKLVFGSDWPAVPSVRENIENIKRLPLREETKRKILVENARKILGL